MAGLKPAGQFDRKVLANLEAGPRYCRSFPQAINSVLTRLVRDGYVQRCAKVGSRSMNMVRLTDAGRARLAELRKG